MDELTGSGEGCKKERDIPSKAMELERSVTVLEERFGDLQARLELVSSKKVDPDKPPDGRPKEMSLPCPLAEHLRQLSARVRIVCERIEYQLSVLET